MTFSIKKVLDDVHYVEIPDGGGFSCIHLLGTMDDLVIVDTYMAATAPQVIATLEANGARPQCVRAILITHGHNDHFGGLGAIKEWCGAPVWADVHTTAHIEDPMGYFASPLCWMFNSAPGDTQAYAATFGKPTRVDRILREGDVVEHAGLRLDVLHTPGHDRSEMSFHDPNRKVIFSGDLVQGGMDVAKNWLGFFTDPAAQRRSLLRVMDLKPNWNFKGHRTPRTGADVQTDLACAINRLDRIEAAIEDALRQRSPMTTAELTRAVFRTVLGMDLTPSPAYGVVSVTAFLLHLGRRGVIRRTDSLDWERV